jgi:hypothetical protein
MVAVLFETYDEIVDKACEAWMFFANDKNRVDSITKRDGATVIAQGRWYEPLARTMRVSITRRLDRRASLAMTTLRSNSNGL